MKIIGCDLHARQQTIAMLDSDTGELEEKTLERQGGDRAGVLFRTVSSDSGRDRSDRVDAVVPGTDGRAGDQCRVGHPQKIRRAETRKQKHDRRDALLLLKLLAENRFPTIWMPSSEQRDHLSGVSDFLHLMLCQSWHADVAGLKVPSLDPYDEIWSF